jgi:hypothetical protein
MVLDVTGPTTATVRVPAWEQPHGIPLLPAYEMHVLLRVTDAGSPALTRYRRAVLSVLTGGGQSSSGQRCAAVSLAAAPPATDFTDTGTTSSAWYSTAVTPLGELIDNPATRAVLEKHLPDIARQGGAGPGAGMTLRGVQKFVPTLTDEVLDRVDADLAEIPAPKNE